MPLGWVRCLERGEMCCQLACATEKVAGNETLLLITAQFSLPSRTLEFDVLIRCGIVVWMLFPMLALTTSINTGATFPLALCPPYLLHYHLKLKTPSPLAL